MNYDFHQTSPARPGKWPEGWKTDRLPRDPQLYLSVQNTEGEVVQIGLTSGQAIVLAGELQARTIGGL